MNCIVVVVEDLFAEGKEVDYSRVGLMENGGEISHS